MKEDINMRKLINTLMVLILTHINDRCQSNNLLNDSPESITVIEVSNHWKIVL